MEKINVPPIVLALHKSYVRNEINKKIESLYTNNTLRLKINNKRYIIFYIDPTLSLTTSDNETPCLLPSIALPDIPGLITKLIDKLNTADITIETHKSISDDLKSKYGSDTLYFLEILFQTMYSTFRAGDTSRKKVELSDLDTFYNAYSNNLDDQNLASIWTPYTFTNALNVTICPYCNISFIVTENIVKKKKGSTDTYPNITLSPDLDHYLPKSKYPLFAMSLYNLVPSCKVCNSSIKGRVDFSSTLALNPYSNKYIDDFLYFYRKPSQDNNNFIDIFLGYSNDYAIETKKKDFVSAEDYNKAKYMLDFFGISTRYTYIKDFLQKQTLREVYYNSDYINSLQEEFSDLPTFASTQLYQHKTFNTLADINNTMFGKLFKDILKW